jgi:CheY-like chemotaxis protein
VAELFRKGHLLIIDDERPFRTLIQRLLGREGFQVSEASSGEEAIRLFDSGLRVDVMLVDYRMPGLNGGQTLEALRRSGINVPASMGPKYFPMGAKFWATD